MGLMTVKSACDLEQGDIIVSWLDRAAKALDVAFDGETASWPCARSIAKAARTAGSRARTSSRSGRRRVVLSSDPPRVLGGSMFIQVNMTHSDRPIEEFLALGDEFADATKDQRTIRRAIGCQGVDDPTLRVLIAFFDSQEDAEKNSALPGTDQVAQKVAAMSKGDMQFINLNVVEDRAF
jgi:hypothetical protein